MDTHISKRIWQFIELVTDRKWTTEQQRNDQCFAALGIDSLKLVQLIFETETAFGIEIPEHLLFNLETVEELVLLVMHYRKTAA